MTVEKEQNQRIQHLQQYCKSGNLTSDKAHIHLSSQASQYYLSKRYNFALCRIPKIGSSFWNQVFRLLIEGPNAASRIFSKFRALQSKDYSIGVTLSNDERLKSRFVFVARDPFARLYSAYVDRIFLPSGTYGVATDIVRFQRNYTRNQHVCANELTFEDFLGYIVDSVRLGRRLNMHWAPIYTLCDLCDVDTFAVVKMESFSSDVHFALQKAGLSSDLLDIVDDRLQTHRIERTIPGTVEAIVETSHFARKCMNPTEVARRIWISFQIQGYISDSVRFPFVVVDTEEKAANHTFLSDVILKTIKQYPLISEDSKLQRHRFLINAYTGLSSNLLQKIANIYQHDFLLFNYSDSPPSWKFEVS